MWVSGHRAASRPLFASFDLYLVRNAGPFSGRRDGRSLLGPLRHRHGRRPRRRGARWRPRERAPPRTPPTRQRHRALPGALSSPPCRLLGLARTNRIFQNLSVPEIVVPAASWPGIASSPSATTASLTCAGFQEPQARVRRPSRRERLGSSSVAGSSTRASTTGSSTAAPTSSWSSPTAATAPPPSPSPAPSPTAAPTPWAPATRPPCGTGRSPRSASPPASPSSTTTTALPWSALVAQGPRRREDRLRHRDALRRPLSRPSTRALA